jgi:DNA-binding transcriptional ArsR family regulator
MRAKTTTEDVMAGLQRLAEVFKVLGDTTRLRLLHDLGEREVTVGELCERLGLSPSAVSHQLQLLRMARLVKHRKDGRQVFYSLDDDHVKELMAQGLAHLAEGG